MKAMLGSHVRVKNVFSKCATTSYVKCQLLPYITVMLRNLHRRGTTGFEQLENYHIYMYIYLYILPYMIIFYVYIYIHLFI